MLVHGVIVPPRAVLDELVAVVQSVRREIVPAPASKTSFLRRRTEAAATADLPPVLVDVPVDRLQLPITEFGNLTTNDAHRLADAIAAAAANWSPARVCFTGGTALDFPGDPCVWAKLDGDLDSLSAIARGVTQSVEQLGLFVDRRIYRPMMSLATVTESTTGADLEAVVGALEAFRGQEWTVEDVVLTTDSFDQDRSVRREYQRIQVG